MDSLTQRPMAKSAFQEAAMSFEWRRLNPLDIFFDFRVFPRIVLFAGFVLWFIGLYQAVSFHNPTVVLGTTLILSAISCHYFGHRQAMSGIGCGLLSLLCFLWFLNINYADNAPHLVRDFWRILAQHM